MSKYNNNNYFRTSGTDESSMRFNKRPRYGANNSPRFSQTNATSYNYQQNRNNSSQNNSSSPYQNNTQYDRSPRNYYGRGTTKRPLHKQQPSNFERQNHQSSPTYSNVSRTIAALSPSPNGVGAATSRTTLPPPIQQTTPHAVNTATIGNQQQHSGTTVPLTIPDQTFAYNNYFYPNYNTDSTESPTTSSYGMNYNISQYMWQTITSTPPPNLLQPPLPQQSPPTKLPPLPGADVTPTPHLQPPPAPHSSLLTISSSVTPDYRDKTNDSRNISASKPVVKMKVKRKAMSSRYNTSKNWSQEDAELALKAEEDITINQQKDTILVLRFPDPEINREVVKSYSPAIESVHFQLNFAPRYCFVHLKPGTNVKETIDILSKVPFGSGFLKAELKDLNTKPRNSKPCDIDPCTLYVGNLPTTIACTVLKEHFPGASRIDIGFAQRMKYTRYAFIRYPNVQQSIEAYKRMSDAEIGGRSLLLRFRRTGTQRDDSKDDDLAGDEYSIDDFSLQQQSATSPATGVAENENSIQLSQKPVDINETNAQINVNTSNGSSDKANLNDKDADNNARNHGNSKHDSETNPEAKNENHQAETIRNNSNIRLENHEVSTNSTTVPLIAQNIKPDPDIDPDDKVVGNDDITSRFDYYDHRVKQEKEKETVTDFEFFAPADDQPNGSTRNSLMNEITSLSTTTTKDCDDTNDAGNSLAEFLTTCQRAESPKDDGNDGTPSTKRDKTLQTLLEKEIKNEPLEEITSEVIQTTQKSCNETTITIKREYITLSEDLNNKSIDDVCNVDILPEDNFLQSIIMDKTKETSTDSKGSSKTMSNLKRQSPNTSQDNFSSAKTLRLENESQVNNNNNNNNKEKINSNIQKSSPKSKSSLLSNSASQNLPKDNDDLVPTSALFLRNDNENSANEMYDDEFFATKSQKLSQNALASPLSDVKQEPVCRKRNHTSYPPAEKPTNQPNQVFNKTKSNDPTKSIKAAVSISNNYTNKPTMSMDEDDLVPADNCLLSRQSLSQMDFSLTTSLTTPEIKLEKDFDDLFSTTPFNKTYQERFSDKSTNGFRQQQPNKNNNNANDFITSFGDNTNLNVNNNKENSNDNSSTDTLKAKSSKKNLQNLQKNSHDSNNGTNEYDELSDDDDDDDLVIISESFPPISKPTIRTSSAECNFLGQSELLTFKSIPTTTDHNINSLYATIHESSRKLQHHDNLDKLFQQLDSDSEGEL